MTAYLSINSMICAYCFVKNYMRPYTLYSRTPKYHLSKYINSVILNINFLQKVFSQQKIIGPKIKYNREVVFSLLMVSRISQMSQAKCGIVGNKKTADARTIFMFVIPKRESKSFG